MIERNRNPVGKVYNVVFGVACVLDGLVRIFSFGFLHTCMTLDLSRWATGLYLKRRSRKEKQ